MAKKFTFQSVLIKGAFNGTYADFPFDSQKEFGTKKHVWCDVSIEGKTYSMNLLPNGNGGHWLHLKKEIRDEIGKQEGDTVNVELNKSDKTRTIEIPEYLQWLLDNDQQMKKYFNKLNISGKMFWIEHIEDTKNEDTKVDRINKFFEFLHQNYAGKV
ncbi:YdeI/OmpD-associated family protein [Maribellus sediminis]|uniref:YdeI/OmpD-associated family protein n=1 Tax=Maribellus sediminis TaxID=2696285 RepID=UPI001431CC21|nr:YdeI/OmpD-associated family protein [Maribellus sediminis]